MGPSPTLAPSTRPLPYELRVAEIHLSQAAGSSLPHPPREAKSHTQPFPQLSTQESGDSQLALPPSRLHLPGPTRKVKEDPAASERGRHAPNSASGSARASQTYIPTPVAVPQAPTPYPNPEIQATHLSPRSRPSRPHHAQSKPSPARQQSMAQHPGFSQRQRPQRQARHSCFPRTHPASKSSRLAAPNPQQAWSRHRLDQLHQRTVLAAHHPWLLHRSATRSSPSRRPPNPRLPGAHSPRPPVQLPQN